MEETIKLNFIFLRLYVDQGFIVSDGNYERITSRLTLDSQILPKLNVGAVMGYTYGNQRTPNGSVNEVFALDIMRASFNQLIMMMGRYFLIVILYLIRDKVQSGNPLLDFYIMRYIKLVMILLALLFGLEYFARTSFDYYIEC